MRYGFMKLRSGAPMCAPYNERIAFDFNGCRIKPFIAKNVILSGRH